MRTSAVVSAALSLLAFVSPSSARSTTTTLDSTFKPPQVFKNANLVHVISVEKNYVKENINVQVENIDNAPQDEYFLPFTADRISRIGGVEVKDRKDAKAGLFIVEVVEFDQERYVARMFRALFYRSNTKKKAISSTSASDCLPRSSPARNKHSASATTC